MSDKELLGFDRELIVAEREIDRTTTEAAAARAVKSAILKRMKKAGGDVQAYKNIVKLRPLEDDERNRLRENEDRIASVLGITLWRLPSAEVPQGALWDEETVKASAEHKEAIIESDGYRTRRERGKESYSENPHDAGTREHHVWAQAWKKADADWGDKPETAKIASTKPRGRPKKGGAAMATPKVVKPRKAKAAAISPFN